VKKKPRDIWAYPLEEDEAVSDAPTGWEALLPLAEHAKREASSILRTTQEKLTHYETAFDELYNAIDRKDLPRFLEVIRWLDDTQLAHRELLLTVDRLTYAAVQALQTFEIDYK
jgi:hypothetical protein